MFLEIDPVAKARVSVATRALLARGGAVIRHGRNLRHIRMVELATKRLGAASRTLFVSRQDSYSDIDAHARFWLGVAGGTLFARRKSSEARPYNSTSWSFRRRPVCESLDMCHARVFLTERTELIWYADL